MNAGLSLLVVALTVAAMPHACGEDGSGATTGADGGAAGASGSTAGGTGGSGRGGSSGMGGGAGTASHGQWKTVDPSTLPKCGAGCTTLTGRLGHPGYHGFAYSPTAVSAVLGYEDVVDNVYKGALIFDHVPGGETRSYLAEDGFGWAYSTTSPTHVAVIRPQGLKGTVEVIDRATGESRTVAKYNQKTDHPELPVDYGVSATAINSKYVFWLRESEGWYRQDLKTGDTKLLLPAGFGCDTLHPTEDGILCGNTSGFKAMLIDQETGEKKLLSPDSKPIQEDAAFSPSGQYAVWVDYRDPPGEASTDAFRNGGEIYLHDRKVGTTKRMTFDSPGAPRGKTRPAVGDSADTLVWLETCKTCEANPSGMDTLYSLTTTVVRLDVATGKKCRLEKDPITPRGARSTLFARKWYHYVKIYNLPEGVSTGPYLAALDLDDPVVPWECD